MDKITDHKVNGLNEALDITVLDQPGQGSACHEYEISWPDMVQDPEGGAHAGGNKLVVKFQNGPIQEHGINGVSNEALLAILIHRMRGFQNGPYNCDANANALSDLEGAMKWLQSRTQARLARGVEGTHVV